MQTIFGLEPAFSFKVVEQIPLSQYYNLILIGIFAGIVGILFNKALLFSQDIFKDIKIKGKYKTIIIMLISGVVGAIYFTVLDSFIVIPDIYYANFIIYGMAAIMTAVVRAPILSILLVSEMTGSFSSILGLCIISIVAYLVAEFFNNEPIYDSLLARFLGKDNNAEE